MSTIHIVDYLKTHTQAQLADLMGVTSGAVWQMIRDKRDITLQLDNTEQVLISWTETKTKTPKRRLRYEQKNKVHTGNDCAGV